MKTPDEVRKDEERERQERDKHNREEAQHHHGGCRYRLLAPHVIDGKTLPVGTEVGEGTEYPYDAAPSNQMEGCDEESKKRVNDIHQKLYGRDAPWHSRHLHEEREEARRAEEEQRKAEEGADPVSHQQAWEKGKKWDGPKHPYVTAREGGVAPPIHSPTVSGDRSVPMGPATAEQDIESDKVHPRAEKPLQDQMPKEGGAPSGGTQQPKG